MKKFFEKHDLVKIALIMILLTVVLSWIIPQGYFNAGELVKGEITRVGMFDMVTYGLLGMYYFTVLVAFLFVLGAFYQFLSSLGAYQKLTDKIAAKIKGKEILFSLIISFVFAGLASIVNEYLVLVAFMPFIITICNKLKMDKISSFVTTFGAMLVGILGSTISAKVAGMNVQYLQTAYNTNLLEKILLFALAFIIYSLFNILYLKKTLKDNKEMKTFIWFFIALVDIGLLVLFFIIKRIVFYILLGVTVLGIILYIAYELKLFNKIIKKKDSNKKNKKDSKKKDSKKVKSAKKEEKVIKVVEANVGEDLFENNIKDSEKANTIPLIIVGILAIITILLAYIPWTTVFKVDWFTKAFTAVTEAKVFGVPIFKYILGNVTEFGSWDLFGVQVVMILSIIVLAICYKKGLTDIIDSFSAGFKKSGKLVVILLLAYVILEFAVMYPVIPTILGSILGDKFNVFTTALAGGITSLFTSEYQYTINLIYSQVTSAYASNINVISIILQSIYGLVSFFAPSSAMLLVGLSYLEIPYKDWMKYIWKFLVAMLVVIIVMALIIA